MKPGFNTRFSGFNLARAVFADATLGNRMVLGVDANNDIVFAIFMDPNAALTSARVWMVQFEAISNPNANNPDDSVNLFDSIGVAASTSLTFDFNAVHPGSNLFATVGDVDNALIVVAEHPVIGADGVFSTVKGGVIKTSQGGGPTTIGVNSQMFDPDDGATPSPSDPTHGLEASPRARRMMRTTSCTEARAGESVYDDLADGATAWRR
jgi:hypothetical protein